MAVLRMRYPFFLLTLISWPHYSFADPSTSNLQKLIDDARTLRELIQSDPHRPIYHFVSPEGHAMPFDPNGAIFWKGKYHLGYIYQKSIQGKLRDVWGHIVSTDLMHWTIYPDMLNVKDGDIEEGIYSGGAFLSKDGVPHLIYYGKGASANLIAYAVDDDLKVWKKLGSNPVLKAPTPMTADERPCCFHPKGMYSVFDPDAWYDTASESYYQISGGMKPALFKSTNMLDWKYIENIVDTESGTRYPFEDLSCPDFFSLGDKSMLLFLSHAYGAQYYIGSFSGDRFTPERHGRMNWKGGGFFAPEQLQDAEGRNIIWGWVTQPKNQSARARDYGWAGIMSLPREVSLDNTGQLRINPPHEISLIRLNQVSENTIALRASEEVMLRAEGRSIEIKMEIFGGTESAFGVKVFVSADGQEETVIYYDPRTKELVIDFQRSSIGMRPVSIPVVSAKSTDALNPIVEHVSEQRAPLVLKKGEPLQLDIFLDRSIIEVFANGRQAVTQIVYPELDGSTRVKVFSGSESVIVKNIQSWSLAETNFY